MDYLEYIKNETWFSGVRNELFLVIFSNASTALRTIASELYGVEPAESLLVPLEGDYLRFFNTTQAREFHQYSQSLIKKNPELLDEWIAKDYANWEQILKKCKDLNVDGIKEILDLAKNHAVYFLIIFSLGMKLTELDPNSKYLKKHDFWRNDISAKDKELNNSLIRALRPIYNKPEDLIKYLTEKELIEFIGNNLVIDPILEKRKQGFIFLGLKEKQFVSDDQDLINEICLHFLEKRKESRPEMLQGMVCFKKEEKIKGNIVSVKDIKYINDLTDKILVTVQTTPEFIPYLKNVKAIVTDEGGITCHAAIISRELGIPCIVGTKIATRILKDNDIIELNLENGEIKKINP